MRRMHGLGLAVVTLAVAATIGVGFTGCGTPGAPLPPSLNLPDRVENLTAVRQGNRVELHWTMPTKNTDRLLLKGNVTVRVCRRVGAGACELVGGDLFIAPGAQGKAAETLPGALTAGAARVVSYFVELKNASGRSAGLSNGAPILAGAAPLPITDLTAEVRKAGVVLHWTPDRDGTAVRLHRTLLTPPAKKPKESLLEPQPEPLEMNLLVESGAAEGRALDKEIRFGQSYLYSAQRVARVTVEGKTLELPSAVSAAVRVEALDIFPPAVPTGLAAVATVGENGTETAIDLSWQPGSDADLTGYVVYRREGDGEWKRISPAAPIVGPAFHDANVLPGHTYSYAVSAIDQGGHESTRSAPAQEMVPAQ